MNAKQIADRLVEKGILGIYEGLYYRIGDMKGRLYPADAIINNWRTAGACLEAMIAGGKIADVGEAVSKSIPKYFCGITEELFARGDTLPAAICAAFAEVE